MDPFHDFIVHISDNGNCELRQIMFDRGGTCLFCLNNFSCQELEQVPLSTIMQFLKIKPNSDIMQRLANKFKAPETPQTKQYFAQLCLNCCKTTRNLADAIDLYDMARVHLSHQLALVDKIFMDGDKAHEVDYKSETAQVNSTIVTEMDDSKLIKKLRTSIKRSCKTRSMEMAEFPKVTLHRLEDKKIPRLEETLQTPINIIQDQKTFQDVKPCLNSSNFAANESEEEYCPKENVEVCHNQFFPKQDNGRRTQTTRLFLEFSQFQEVSYRTISTLGKMLLKIANRNKNGKSRSKHQCPLCDTVCANLLLHFANKHSEQFFLAAKLEDVSDKLFATICGELLRNFKRRSQDPSDYRQFCCLSCFLPMTNSHVVQYHFIKFHWNTCKKILEDMQKEKGVRIEYERRFENKNLQKASTNFFRLSNKVNKMERKVGVGKKRASKRNSVKNK